MSLLFCLLLLPFAVFAQRPDQGSWLQRDLRCGERYCTQAAGCTDTVAVDVEPGTLRPYNEQIDSGICTGDGVRTELLPGRQNPGYHYAIKVPYLGYMTRRLTAPQYYSYKTQGQDLLYQARISSCIPTQNLSTGVDPLNAPMEVRDKALIEADLRAQAIVAAMLRPGFVDYVRRNNALVVRDTYVNLNRPDLQACLESVINYACARSFPADYYTSVNATHSARIARQPICRHVCQNVVGTCHPDLRIPRRFNVRSVPELALFVPDGTETYDLGSVGVPGETCDGFAVDDTSFDVETQQQYPWQYQCTGATVRRHALIDWRTANLTFLDPPTDTSVVPWSIVPVSPLPTTAPTVASGASSATATLSVLLFT